MKVLEHLNKAAAYIPLVDSQDLSALPAIINELEQTMLEESTPEAILIQAVRYCKLAKHITLNKADFENGIRKLSQNIINDQFIGHPEIPDLSAVSCPIIFGGIHE